MVAIRIKASHAGFTKVELLLVTLVVILLAGILVPSLRKAGVTRGQVSCLSKLGTAGQAFSAFAADNEGLLPMHPRFGSALETSQYFRRISNYLHAPFFLRCPNDERVEAADWVSFNNKTLSYWVSRVESVQTPTVMLAGDRNISSEADKAIPASRVSGWLPQMGLHRTMGHVLFGDGNVRKLNSDGLIAALRASTNDTTSFVIP